jgi:peptidoglycan/xylan/chitin deacetylase (PgdA/CDA1 family)
VSLRTVKRLAALAISLVYRLVRRPRQAPVVLTYHAVAEQDLQRFDEQMSTLRLHGRVTFADEALSNGRPAVAVTFDDALESVFDGALQVMAAQQIPATVFVPTGYMGSEAQWRSVKGAENRPSGRVATAERLKALDRRLVRLGSHSVSHPPLASLSSIDLARELESSKQVLEELTRAPITMLSLPYGSYDARVLEAAQATGYDRVFANVPVSRQVGRASVLWGRINVSSRDWPVEFRLKVEGAYDWMVVAMPLKRALLKPFKKPELETGQ